MKWWRRGSILTEALNGGFGNVIVDIEPTVRKDKYDRTQDIYLAAGDADRARRVCR